eukprot:PhF_6_TR37099/c0_g1_i1/m.54473/K03260/EIF4G; translation initiation factor 4G
MNPNAKSFVPTGPNVDVEITNFQDSGLKSNLRPSALPFVLPAASCSAAKNLRASAPEFRPTFLTNSVGSMSSLTTESPIASPNPHVSENKSFVPIQAEPQMSLPPSQTQPAAAPQHQAPPTTTCSRHHYTLQALLALRCHASHPPASLVSSDVYVPQPVFASNIMVAPPSAPSKPNALRAHKEGMAFLERRVISTLNKLTPEKYDTLIRELLKEMGVELRVTHEGMEAMLQRIIPRIVDKAILESKFCDMYAQLCSDLFKEIRNLDNGAIIYTEVIDDKSEMTFDSSQRFQIHLLNKLQSEFQVQVVENSDDEGPRKRKLATAQFVAEIFFRGLLPPGVLHKVLARLLNVKAPKVIDVECACKIFPIIGRKLEEEGNIMNQYFSAIKAIRESPTVSTQTRIKVLLDNLSDLRAHKWIPKHSNKATKLSECNDSHSEQQREVSHHHSSSSKEQNPKNLAERLRGILDGKHQVPTSHSSNSRATPNSKTPNRSTPNTPQRGSPVSKEVPSTTVYITQIDNMITEGQLMEFLTAFGDVHKVRLCGNTTQPTQYGFFEFATAEGAQKCLVADRTVLGRFSIHCSQSRNAVHDTLPHDVVMGPRGPTRACLFGEEFPNRTLAESVTLQPAPIKKSGTRTPTMSSSASVNSLCDQTPGLALDDETGTSSNEDSHHGSLNQRIVSDEELVNLEQHHAQQNITINFPALVNEYLTAFSSDEDRDVSVSQQLGQLTDPSVFIKDSVSLVTQKSKLVAERNALACMIKFIHPALKTMMIDAIQSTVEDAVMEEQREDCPLIWANFAHFFSSCKQANTMNSSDIEHVLQPVRTSEDEWSYASSHLSVFVS